jgi:mRNA interferase RelE/StbE
MVDLWNIIFEKRVEKDLENLPKEYISKFQEVLFSLTTTPFPAGVKKLSKPNKKNYYRIRIGDYRIIYSVEKDGRIIIILVVRHRKDVYKIKL